METILPHVADHHAMLQQTADQLFGALDPWLAPVVEVVALPKEQDSPLAPLAHPGTRADSARLLRMSNALFSRGEAKIELLGAEGRLTSPEADEFAQSSHRSMQFAFAVRQSLDAIQSGESKSRWRCSPGVDRGEYVLGVVIGLSSAALDSHLVHETNSGGYPDDELSLTQYAAGSFLVAAVRALRDARPFDFDSMPWPEELLRQAGAHLLLDSAGHEHSGVIAFDALTAVGALPYEGSTCSGQVLLAARWTHDACLHVTFRNPIEIGHYKTVRKLATAAGELALVTDGDHVFGFGRGPEHTKHAVANFTALSQWELRRGDTRLLTSTAGLVRLPRERLSHREIRQRLATAFPALDKGRMNGLVELAGEVPRPGTSGLLVVHEDPPSTIATDAGFAVEPHKATVDEIRGFCRMDGAVLLDLDLNVHAIGVILDGAARRDERIERGSRFNSALRFVGRYGGIALVMSEDGMIDLLPEDRHGSVAGS